MHSGIRTAFITGGASGIGHACARRFIMEGMNVCIFDRKDAARAAGELDGDRAIGVAGDATSVADVEGAVKFAVERFGSLDVLVCSAGISSVEPFLEMSAATFQRTIAVNVSGSMIAAQAAGRVMSRQGHGSMVFLGSVYGAAGAPNRAAYCASKGAIHNLTRSLAVELGAMGIRVNAVAPTGVRTPMIQTLIDQGSYNLAGVQGRCPLGRLAEPDEVADAISYLSGTRAAMINGAILPVDGGWLANGYTFS